jgi:hypothetical protein
MNLHPRREGGWIGLGSGDFSKFFFSYVYYVVCRSQEGVGSGRQEGSGVGRKRLELVMVTCLAPALTKVREKLLDWG